MGLQLGLESLNNSPAAVVPFSVESLLDMGDQRLAIESLMTQLDTYYSAAVNAMTIRKSIKKFGKTQSTAFLVGQEGLNFAQSFSMEGFWAKTKEFLLKIWEKIKEWWGRFWGMFFSVESRLSSFISDLGGSKSLGHNVVFDAADYKTVTAKSQAVSSTIKLIKEALENVSDKNILDKIVSYYGTKDLDTRQNGAVISKNHSAYTIHYELRTKAEVLAIAKALKDKVFELHKNSKRDIDDYTKKAIDKIKTMKVDKDRPASGGDIYGYGGTTSRKAGDDTTAEEQDVAVKIFKQSAKLNNEAVSWCLNQATNIAVKLMAHTNLKD